MKQPQWINGDKILCESGHRTFDRQTNVIGDGNMIASTMMGAHVRPKCDVENSVGEIKEPGYLRRYDLNQWTYLPDSVRQYVKSVTETESAWIYCFFHRNREGRAIVHGWVIVGPYPESRLLKRFVTGPTYKSYNVIEYVAPYVSNVDGSAA